MRCDRVIYKTPLSLKAFSTFIAQDADSVGYHVAFHRPCCTLDLSTNLTALYLESRGPRWKSRWQPPRRRRVVGAHNLGEFSLESRNMQQATLKPKDGLTLFSQLRLGETGGTRSRRSRAYIEKDTFEYVWNLKRNVR